MPIQLDDLQTSAVNIKTYDPKFFDSSLTGKGKKMGLINENRNPSHILPTQTTSHDNKHMRKRKYTNGDTKTSLTPVNPIKYNLWAFAKTIPFEVADMIEIGKTKNTTIYAQMPVHSLVLTEKDTTSQNGVTSSTKELTVCYQIMLFAVSNPSLTTAEMVSKNIEDCPAFVKTVSRIATSQTPASINYYTNLFTCNPTEEFKNIVSMFNTTGINLNPQAIMDFINNYDLYSALCKRSEEWQTTIDKTLSGLFRDISAIAYASSSPKNYLNELVHQLRYIEDYSIPLDLYRNIYTDLAKCFKKDDATILCKQNLNLLLSDTLNNLDINRQNLIQMPVNPNNPVDISYYSTEQKKAITSTEPLILVQAGAGTGKSTVILGRINYMIGAGVKPDDITVLSFTNAAADNITAKNPNIHSMTIARMIHTIYTNNFSEHELSSIDTMINSLDIYFHNDQIAIDFKHKLKSIVKNESDAFTQMNNFVEYHYDDVIRILDTIKQTCLEMEIIICYQQIDNFKEPASIQSKYLIIDEVQDNSIFEFIYTLKYVDKHKESLFIVGDCSQTLYEFRASNPKALNVLEGSDVFSTYQLQVNYRSNQEILDFANVALQNIEANQYAHIQLQANSLNTVTEKSFTDAVQFHYECLNRITDFTLTLGNLLQSDVKPYIDSKLAAGEKVAFLAYTRRHVNIIKTTLQEMYPDKSIVSLMPDKMYNTVIFSEFIKRYWDEIRFVPTQNIINIIAQEIYAKLDYLVYNKEKALPSTQKLISNWRIDQGANIASWQNQVTNGQMTVDDFMTNVKESMLQFEIRNNAVKQALLSTRNEQNKTSDSVNNADFILSTIHSTKGLEFDNVVVVYKNENDMPEDKKRMYYVAFTRAIKSEFILSYGSVKNPRVEADYNTIVKNLHAKYPDPNSKLVVSLDKNPDDKE